MDSLCITCKIQVWDSAWLVSDEIFAENRHKGHIEIQLLTLLRIGAVSEGFNPRLLLSDLFNVYDCVVKVQYFNSHVAV